MAATSGGMDLSGLKAQAEARRDEPGQPGGGAAQRPGGAANEVSPVVEVTAQNFEAEVVRRSVQVPIVLQVGSERSDDSESLRRTLGELAREAKLKFIYAHADADKAPEIAQALGVRAVPTVVALAAGRPLTTFQGSQPKEELQRWVDALVSQIGGQLQGLPEGTVPAGDAPAEPERDPRLVAAEEKLSGGDFDGAIADYDKILASEPRNEEAQQARDAARLLKRQSENADGDPIARANEEPGDIDLQFAAADAEVAAGTPERAFDRLLGLIPSLGGEEKSKVRERLVELFSLFDAADERVLAARRRLANSLY